MRGKGHGPSLWPVCLPIPLLLHSSSASALSFPILALFPSLEFAKCPWLLGFDPWRQPSLRAGPCSVLHCLLCPPNGRGCLVFLYPWCPCFAQDSAHSAFGLSLYPRGCPGKGSGSFSARVLANTILIPVIWIYFIGGFEDLHCTYILPIIEKRWWRKVGENPTHFGVRYFWTYHLWPHVGVAKVL